jgi:antitoxin ParD1/3/4
MGTMNVSLPDDLIEFVHQEANGGGYGNNSDVVRDGLRLLREQRAQRTALQRLIAEGVAEIESGQGVPLTSDLLRDIAARAEERAKAREDRKD